MNEIKAEIKKKKKAGEDVSELTQKYETVKADYEQKKQEEKKISKTINANLNLHRQKIGMVFQQFNLFANTSPQLPRADVACASFTSLPSRATIR